MNRLDQLKETLKVNLSEVNRDRNIEFVILNYNSQDGMDAWVAKHLMSDIEAGRINYYKTSDPLFFNHSHAKNVAMRLAKGSVLCNINADHFIGPDFLNYVYKVFSKEREVVLSPIPINYHIRPKGNLAESWGKVCVRKEHFYSVNGFDEAMIKYGNDDIDFINRLEMLGIKRKMIKGASNLQLISHGDDQRYSSREIINNISKIVIRYLSPSSTELLYLFNDQKYELLTIIDNSEKKSSDYRSSYYFPNYQYKYDVKDFFWEEGIWKDDSTFFFLREKTVEVQKPSEAEKKLLKSSYLSISTTSLKDILSKLNYTEYNLNKMRKNVAEQNIMVNNNGFGKANVVKNFTIELTI